MPELKVPRLVVAGAVFVLFLLALYTARQYGLVGNLQDLTVAIAATLACLGIVAGLIYANYVTYGQRSNHHLNSSP